jgi:hypothetical protein
MRQPNRSRMTLTKSEKICYPALRAMMRRNRLIQRAGISFPVVGILLTVFVLAKAFEFGPIAAWSWFWVFSPVWIPLAAMVAFGILAGICAGIAAALEK